MFQSECLSSTRFTTKIRIMLLALQDKSLFTSFKFWSDLVMVGQSKLIPGQMPGYARVWLRLCTILNVFVLLH